MKRKLSILVLMISFSLFSFAQSIGDYIDVIHLKNGGVIKGIIIEQVAGKSVKIKTKDGNEFTYQIEEVAKFVREQVSSTSSTNNGVTANGKTCDSKKTCDTQKACSKGMSKCSEYKKKDKGFFAEIDLIGNGASSGFRITPGYKFGQFGYLGIGFGLESTRVSHGERIPELSLNIVYAGDILKRKITPFYQIAAGYGFSLDRYGYNKHLSPKWPDFLGKNKFYEVEDNDYARRLNYGGPQGELVLGVKFHTKKKIYYRLGLDARLTSNFTDSHYLLFNDNGEVNGTILEKDFKVMPGLGARFGIGF